MKLRSIHYLLLIVIILSGVYLRSFYAGEELYIYPDAFYHRSIMMQNFERGNVSNINFLDMCYSDWSVSHPVGFYAIPHYVAKVFGVDTFQWMPAVYWIFTIIILYLLLKQLYNRNLAIIACGFVAFIYGNIQRSEIGTFRGENVIMPFLLGGLLLVYNGFFSKTKKNYYYLVFGGIISAIPIVLWNGGGSGVIISVLSVVMLLLFKFLFSKVTIEFIQYSIAFILSQGLVVFIISRLYSFVGKGKEFVDVYYYLFVLLPFLGFVGILYLKNKIKLSKGITLGIFLVGIVSLFLIFYEKISNFLISFRLKQSVDAGIVISEIMKVNFIDLWNSYYLLLLLAPVGMVVMLKKLKARDFYLFSFIVTTFILLIIARRFLFYFSIPIAILGAIALDYYIKKNKKGFWDWSLIIVFTVSFGMLLEQSYYLLFIPLFFIILFYSFKKYRRYFAVAFVVVLFYLYGMNVAMSLNVPDNNFVPESVVEVIKYSESIEPTCILTEWDVGGLINNIANQHSFISSVAQEQNRIKAMWNYWFTSKEPQFEIQNGHSLVDVNYLLTQYPDGYFQDNYDAEFLMKRLQVPQDTNVELLQDNDGKVNLYLEGNERIFIEDYEVSNVAKVYFDGNVYYNIDGVGCLIVVDQKNMIYIHDKFCDSNLVKMLMLENITNGELVYHYGSARLYSFGN